MTPPKPPLLLKDFGPYGEALRAELLPILQAAFTVAQSEHGDRDLLLLVRAVSSGLELVSLGMPILGERLIAKVPSRGETEIIAFGRPLTEPKPDYFGDAPDSSGSLPDLPVNEDP